MSTQELFEQDELLDSTQDEVEELFGSKEVRWYQRAARLRVEQILAHNPKARILLKLSTGTGKTLTSGTILLSDNVKHSIIGDVNRPLRVIFVAHRHHLLTQAERAFNEESGIVTVNELNLKDSSMWKNNNNKSKLKSQTEIYYQSAFSEIPDSLVYDLVIIDEAHHESMSSIQYKLDELGNCPILGLSATPDRSDGFIVKFDEIFEPISREQAVEEGWLSPTNIHSFVDCSGRDKTEIISDILDNFGDQMGKTMVFVKTKKEVANITAKLRQLGYKAVGLLTQSKQETTDILDKFSDGEIQFIVNCNKLGEGIDVKGATTVLLGRQVGSYALLNQVIGRTVRNDSESHVYELINPLSSSNLDATVVVGEPETHRLVWKQASQWVEDTFDYVTHKTNKQLGISSGLRVQH